MKCPGRLSIYLSIYLSTYLPTYLSIYLPIYLSTVQRWTQPCALCSRCRGWVNTEFLQKCATLVRSGDADERLARLQQMADSLQAEELHAHRTIRAQQLVAWAQLALGGNAGSGLSPVAGPGPVLLALVAEMVPGAASDGGKQIYSAVARRMQEQGKEDEAEANIQVREAHPAARAGGPVSSS